MGVVRWLRVSGALAWSVSGKRAAAGYIFGLVLVLSDDEMPSGDEGRAFGMKPAQSQAQRSERSASRQREQTAHVLGIT